MNLSTIALILLAWQMLTSQNTAEKKSQKKPDFTELFSDDTKNIIDCVGKLSKGDNEDKMGAILQMASNPTVMNLVQNIFPQKDSPNAEKTTDESDTYKKENPLTNEEGYTFETPSKASREFFRPIDNIADAEVKHKLYWFYDNWYVK